MPGQHGISQQTTASRRRAPWAAALLCAALSPVAHADLWAFVDSRGVTHFAAQKIDANYKLFFRGDQFDSARDTYPDGAVAASPDDQGGAAGARKLAFIDISPGYKSVRTHMRGVAQSTGIEYELLKAVIATESGFNARAVSPRGAVGLMQLMPQTASRFGVAADNRGGITQKLEDPLINLKAGASYLRYLLELFDGRKDLALAAYNAGEGAVQRAGNRIPAYRETHNYVKSVLGLYAMLKPPEPVLAHRAHQARQGAPGRIRMEIPAGSASSTSDNPSPGAPGLDTVVQAVSRATLQDFSANE